MKYIVMVPISGRIDIEVEAENKREAKEKAFDVDFDIDLKGNGVELEELEMHERIIQGNVCHATHWEIEVEEI